MKRVLGWLITDKTGRTVSTAAMMATSYTVRENTEISDEVRDIAHVVFLIGVIVTIVTQAFNLRSSEGKVRSAASGALAIGSSLYFGYLVGRDS